MTNIHSEATISKLYISKIFSCKFAIQPLCLKKNKNYEY